TESLEFHARDYALINGGRYTLSLNVINRGRGLREVVNRQKPVYISRGYIDSDELVYSLPAGYRLESRPSDQRLKTDFGEFSAEISLTDNTLVYKRRLRLNEGVYPAETYAK